MAESTPRGIQATLFDYFQDTEYFDLQEAEEHVLEHEKRDVNRESIRARIYEGIDKGLFERVGKGLYTVTRKDEQGRENTCLLINGDGRDLSMFPDNSVDAIITDHPYSLKTSLKGGNRNFADYELFQYNEQDLLSKFRVLRPGAFLVEFLPEENGDNYQYLYQVKEMARKAGFEYYAKVPWRKGDFVANTGRKSKNTEDICFFTKGRARDLRPDAKKDKADPGVEHFMSGAAGMLPTVFDVAPVKKGDKIHQAEKPVELLEQILRFVTKEDELVLDQFAGSGVLGEAALNTHRNSILIEKDDETYNKLRERISALGEVETFSEDQREIINIAIDALEAAHEGPAAAKAFAQYQNQHGMDLAKAYAGLSSFMYTPFTDEQKVQQEALEAAAKAMESSDCIDLIAPVPDKEPAHTENTPCCDWCGQSAAQVSYRTLYEDTEFEQTSRYNECSDCAILSTKDLLDKVEKLHQPEARKVLECSIRGDRRFSALFATVTIKGKEKSIEEWFQDAKRTADGKRAGKGKPFDHIVDPFTGDKLPVKDAVDLYRGLWITYLSKHPDLVEYASQFDDFTDSFQDPNARQQQLDAYAANPFDPTAEFFYKHSGLMTAADVIGAYVKGNREHYVAAVKSSHWYKNMASKTKKPSLATQIQAAGEKYEEQMALFDNSARPRGHWEGSR